MAVPRVLTSLGKALVVALVLVPPAALWLSGRFGEDADREPQPAAPAPLATLPRSETTAPPSSRPATPPDLVPTPAPPVTVGPGTLTLPPAVPGAAPVPAPREGNVVGEPHGVPDPNRGQSLPR